MLSEMMNWSAAAARARAVPLTCSEVGACVDGSPPPGDRATDVGSATSTPRDATTEQRREPARGGTPALAHWRFLSAVCKHNARRLRVPAARRALRA